MDYLDYLSELCHKSRCQQSTTTENSACGSNKWGKMIDLVPSVPRRNTGSSVRSKTADLSTAATADTVEKLADHESHDHWTDCNQNLVGKMKPQQLPATSTSTVQKGSMRLVYVDDLSATNSAADSDFDAGPQPSVGRGKKQAAGQKKAKNSTAKDPPVKSKPGRGPVATRGKKEQVAVETKRPRKSRKAKEGANTQMKLQFASESTSGKCDYQDAFANDDAYTFGSGSSPEPKATVSYRDSRWQDKKTASTAADCMPPLAQRVMSRMMHGHMQCTSSLAAASFPPYRSSSERASRLFDDMLEKQSKAMPEERSVQSHSISGTDQGSSQPTAATTEKEPEDMPRYFS